jgi:hypothetical protein
MIGNVMELIASAIGVWFAAWGIRRKYQLDLHLDRTAQLLRWVVVAGSVVLGRVGAMTSEPLRLVSALVFLAFIAWPNFAYHLALLLRKGVAPPSSR